jgi:hypothetical protein
MGSSSVALRPRLSITLMIVLGIALVLAAAGLLYLNRSIPQQGGDLEASPEAKAYAANLSLSDVQIKATENFMEQQVVEIEGKITNKGSRTLKSVDVFCMFHGVQGGEIYRERVAIVLPTSKPLEPNQTRSFRLPFDTLPDGWNQAMPGLAMARIVFAQ